VTCAPASGSTFVLGTTSVGCTASDSHGNTVNGTFSVTLRDTTPPVIAAHPDVTVAATSLAGAAVTYAAPAAVDAVGGTFPATCAPASGSAFAIGTTPVICSARDAAGNIAAPTSFNVIVNANGSVSIGVFAAPCVLWLAKGQTVNVAVVGRITSPAGIASASYTVSDSYGVISLSGKVTVGAFGLYGFTVPLVAGLQANDLVGRRYKITITATNKTGGVSSASAVVFVPRLDK
jgi:hypothetical protein